MAAVGADASLAGKRCSQQASWRRGSQATAPDARRNSSIRAPYRRRLRSSAFNTRVENESAVPTSPTLASAHRHLCMWTAWHLAACAWHKGDGLKPVAARFRNLGSRSYSNLIILAKGSRPNADRRLKGPRSAAGHRRACTPGRSCGAGQASTVLRGTITRTHPTRLDTNGESIGALTRSDSAVGIGLRLPASRDIRALGRKRAGASISGRNVRKLSANPINECGQLGAYRDRKALQMTSPADDRHALRAGGHGCASRRLHRRSAC